MIREMYQYDKDGLCIKMASEHVHWDKVERTGVLCNLDLVRDQNPAVFLLLQT